MARQKATRLLSSSKCGVKAHQPKRGDGIHNPASESQPTTPRGSIRSVWKVGKGGASVFRSRVVASRGRLLLECLSHAIGASPQETSFSADARDLI
jgi:hypothetical protein